MARYFLVHPAPTRRAVLLAARRLEPELENQYNRSVQPAEKRTVTNLEPEHLFLALVIDAIDEVARTQEHEEHPTLSTLVQQARFALHLIRLGRKHSYNLAIALLRILYNYPTIDARHLYEHG